MEVQPPGARRILLASQQKAWKAIQEGRFKRSIVPIEVTHNGERKTFDTDEHVRPQSTLEGLMALNLSFASTASSPPATRAASSTAPRRCWWRRSVRKGPQAGPRARVVEQVIVVPGFLGDHAHRPDPGDGARRSSAPASSRTTSTSTRSTRPSRRCRW
ncbi:MAG: hypothetical protein U0802_23810 [Candidatus Binatia bacterium]